MRGRSFKLTQPAFIAFVMIMLLLSTCLVFVPDSVEASGEGWLSGWSYRKSHDITGSTGAGTDYQVKANVFYDDITRFYDVSPRRTTIGTNPTERHTFQPIHSTTILQVDKTVDGSSRKFLAYDSETAGSEIRLYYTDDLDGTWTAYTGNPILGPNVNWYRWPTVVQSGSTFHMILRNITGVVTERWTSTDGISYTYQEDLNYLNAGGRNPYLWLNPNDSQWYLYTYHTVEHIRVRSASTIAGLTTASDVTVLSSYAAPTIAYYHDQYWLLMEGQIAGLWSIMTYYSTTSPSSGFTEAGTSPIIRKDEACPILLPNPSGTKYYLFTNGNSANWYQWTRDVYINQTVNVSSNSETDFDDIRFTDDDGSTELDYWMQEKYDSNYSIYWVEVADDLGSDATFYLYYGNTGVSTTSNGDDTFLFFDNFNDASINWTSKWESTDHSHYSESGGQLTGEVPSGTSEMLNSQNSYSDVAIHTLINKDAGGIGYINYHSTKTSYDGKDIEKLQWYNNLMRVYLNGAYSGITYTADTVNYFEAVHKVPSSGNAQGEVWLHPNNDLLVFRTATPAYTTVYLGYFAWTLGNISLDWVFVRNYIISEPVHATWGSEETPTTYTSRLSVSTGVVDTPGGGVLTGIGMIFRYLQLTDTQVAFTSTILGFSEGREMNITYFWKFSDGQVSTEKNPIKTFEYSGFNGQFNATLIVCHERACSHPLTQDFTVYRWTWIYAIIGVIVVVGGIGMLFAVKERRKR